MFSGSIAVAGCRKHFWGKDHKCMCSNRSCLVQQSSHAAAYTTPAAEHQARNASDNIKQKVMIPKIGASPCLKHITTNNTMQKSRVRQIENPWPERHARQLTQLQHWNCTMPQHVHLSRCLDLPRPSVHLSVAGLHPMQWHPPGLPWGPPYSQSC